MRRTAAGPLTINALRLLAPQKARAGKAKDADTVALEKRVSDALGLAVNVSHRNPGGTVQINYRNLEQLDEVMRRLAKSG